MKVILAALLFSLAFAGAPTGSDRTIIPTIYDDGISCPANCDAHVVLNSADNGSIYASDPSRPRSDAAKCKDSEMCRICFDTDDASCMLARYRGGGPPVGKFDFTPAFYNENCGNAGIPIALAVQCASLDNDLRQSGYARAINCIATPQDPACIDIIATADSLRAADEPLYRECRAIGERAFNKRQRDATARRANDCLYSKDNLGGPNRNGDTWKLLKPAACRPGTYVGRFGTDCCTADARYDASVAPECSGFFVARKEGTPG